jgi:hypothetical protein
MENHISAQLILFGQSVLLGLSAGFAYDLLGAFRLRRTNLTWLWDLLFCFLTAAASFLFLIRCGQGQFRLDTLLGAAGGGILYFCLLSGFFRSVWPFWVENLAVFVRFLLLPARWMRNFCIFFHKICKNLFYFTKKCYTIRKIADGSSRPILRRGGGKRGQTRN